MEDRTKHITGMKESLVDGWMGTVDEAAQFEKDNSGIKVVGLREQLELDKKREKANGDIHDHIRHDSD